VLLGINFIFNQTQANQANQEPYIIFTLEKGKQKVIVESYDSLFGYQKSQGKLGNPVIEQNGTLFLPQDFFEVYLGGKIQVRDETVILKFQEGTQYEEEYLLLKNYPYLITAPGTNIQKLEIKKFSRPIIIEKEKVIYISELFFQNIGEVDSDGSGKIKIRFVLVF
jgi:hypothetical protein